MNRPHLFAALWLSLVCFACTPAHIQVNRTALVPAPQPILFSPTEGTFEVSGSGAFMVGDASLSDESAGLQAASKLYTGSLEWLGRYVTGRYECAIAPADGSQKLFPHQPVTDQSASACGPLLTLRSPERNHMRWHLGLGMRLWNLPVLEYERWDYENGSAQGIEQFSNTRALGTLGIGTTYRNQRLTARGSATLTSQFYVDRVSNYYGYFELDGNEVSKRAALVLSAGVGYDLAPTFRVGLDIASEVLENPVRWGPQILFHVAISTRKPATSLPPSQAGHQAPASPNRPAAGPPGSPTWGPPGTTPPI